MLPLTLPLEILHERFEYDPATGELHIDGFASREAARHAYLAAKAQLHPFATVGG
jgi:hypothetical protein